MPDGYHEIATVFQSIELEDELTFTFSQAESDAVSTELSASLTGEPGSFPLDDTNLIVKAIRAFREHATNEHPRVAHPINVRVHVDKKIPIGAGLAGGSTDGAAALVAMNHYYGHPLTNSQLKDIAARLGADMPFCLSGGTQLGLNKGDELTAYDVPLKLQFVIVKPRQLSIATPWVYKEYDAWLEQPSSSGDRIDPKCIIEYLQRGKIDEAASGFRNAFEPVVFGHYQGLAQIRDHLLALGCTRAHLSGSGPSLFALVPTLETAHFIRRKLIEEEARGDAIWTSKYGWHLDCFIAESVNYGARVVSRNE